MHQKQHYPKQKKKTLTKHYSIMNMHLCVCSNMRLFESIILPFSGNLFRFALRFKQKPKKKFYVVLHARGKHYSETHVFCCVHKSNFEFHTLQSEQYMILLQKQKNIYKNGIKYCSFVVRLIRAVLNKLSLLFFK